MPQPKLLAEREFSPARCPAFALGACGGQGHETVTTVDRIKSL